MQSPFHKPVMALLCWAILLLSACRAETPRPPQKSPEQIERERQRAAREAAEIEAELLSKLFKSLKKGHKELKKSRKIEISHYFHL